MTPERYQRIVDLFHKVSALSIDNRESFLAQSCAGDEDLRAEVNAMLAADKQTAQFLEKPPDDLAAAFVGVGQARSLIGQKLGEYEVIARLGAGGMGEVFLAEDTRLHRRVALKLLPEGHTTDSAQLRRLEQEACAVSALNHPNIVTIYGIGQAGLITFLVTEFVLGASLREQTATGPLTPKLVVDIAIQAASALAAAHRAGIIHRDMKPENIMVRPDGLVKILDFGIAKRRAKPVVSGTSTTSTNLSTIPGSVIGTPRYMSPEQARGLPVDIRTDIFSLGCVLYELLAGRPAFNGATFSDVVAALLTQQPAPLEAFCKTCPVALVRIITRAIQKDCDKRYQTFDEMLSDLKNVQHEIENSTAHPFKALRRYRAAAIFVLLSMIIAAGAFLWRSTGTPIESIAILPFVNEGGADLQYLADGLTDSLIQDLSQVPKLKVISRNSVFRYKGRDVDPVLTGAALKAQAVLVGRLMVKGDRLALHLELVNVRDNRRLWGEQYDRVWGDLLQTQAEISREVLSNLRVSLSGATERDFDRRKKIKPEAYRLYLKGRFYFQRYGDEDIKAAIGFFHQALKEDPKYARAYIGLANSYVQLALTSMPPKEAMPKAREYALQAVELHGEEAEAHVVLGLVKLLYDWDWLGAEQEFKYDSHLNPDSVETFGCYLHSADTLGRSGEAVAGITRHLARDPGSPLYHLELGCATYYARQYDAAISQYWRTIHLDPQLLYAYANVGRAYVLKGMYPEAITELEKGRILDSGSPAVISELAYAWAAAGNREAARTAVDELKIEASHRYVDPYLIAPVYVRLAEPDEAFEWLEKAYTDRSSSMPWLKVEPKFDPVRSDSRYRDLLRRVGFKN